MKPTNFSEFTEALAGFPYLTPAEKMHAKRIAVPLNEESRGEFLTDLQKKNSEGGALLTSANGALHEMELLLASAERKLQHAERAENEQGDPSFP